MSEKKIMSHIERLYHINTKLPKIHTAVYNELVEQMDMEAEKASKKVLEEYYNFTSAQADGIEELEGEFLFI